MHNIQKIGKTSVHDNDQIKKYATNEIILSILVYTISCFKASLL